MKRLARLIRAVLSALNPFGPASGDWHSIDEMTPTPKRPVGLENEDGCIQA